MNVSAAWNYEAPRVFWVVRRYRALKGFPSRSCCSWNASLLISIKKSRHKMGCPCCGKKVWFVCTCIECIAATRSAKVMLSAWTKGKRLMVSSHCVGDTSSQRICCRSLFNIHVNSLPFGLALTVQWQLNASPLAYNDGLLWWLGFSLKSCSVIWAGIIENVLVY